MADLPSFDALRGVPPGTVDALLASRAEIALAQDVEHDWERDRALIGAIDETLAILAEGGDDVARSGGDSSGVGGSGAVGSMSRARRPRWLDGLIARELRHASTRTWSAGRFPRIRLLERLGVVDLPVDDTYVLAMVSSLGPDRAEALRGDPELVDRALWRVFEVEGGGEVSLANVDRFSPESWESVVLELTADGTLDRSRVLAACLDALGLGFAAFRAGWFSATFRALGPSVEEAAGLQAPLRRLLRADDPATVGLAVRQLGRVEKAGLLEVGETLEALAPATLVKTKGTALAALSLAGAGRAEHPRAVAHVAHTALGHPHADVQRRAARMLAELGDDHAVRAAADDLAPSVRHELGLGAEAAQGESSGDERDAVGTCERPPTSMSGDGEDGAGATARQLLSPVAHPVGSDELAERAAGLLEDASDVAELEAVLAALAVQDGADALAPLRARARAVVARGPRTDVGDGWLRGQVARMVLSVLGDPAPPADPGLPALRFLARRIAEVRTASAPLLATPDLPGGWLSPSAFVGRLAQNPHPRHHDMIAALLRLHPEGRAEAAESAVPRPARSLFGRSRSAGSVPAVVRFALEGVAPRGGARGGRRNGPDAWWLAAARSRAAFGADEAPQPNGDIRTRVWTEGGRQRRSTSVRFDVTTPHADPPADDMPTRLPALASGPRGAGSVRALGDWIPSLAAIWPHDAEHFLALTCRPVMESPNGPEVSHDVPRVLDALARHPGRMGPLAAATLAAGISSALRDHRLHAVDALLDLGVSGRVPADAVADVMARFAPAWPAGRWAESLAALALAPGGDRTAIDILTRLLPQLPTDHRGLHRLLEILHEEQLRRGEVVGDPALIRWLGTFSGTSAAARTARSLLG